MKTRQLITMIGLLLSVFLTAQAQENRLTVPGVAVAPGGTISLPLQLDNTADVVALQFTLAMPGGVTLDAGAAQLAQRADGHTMTVRDKGNGRYVFMIFSPVNASVAGRAGKLLTVPLTASSTLEEGTVLPVALGDVVLSGRGGVNLDTGSTAGEIRIARQPDLEVSAVVAGAGDIAPEGTLEVGWVVTNVGGLPTTAGWSEQVFLNAPDGTSKLVGTATADDLLEPGGKVTRSVQLSLPRLLGVDGEVTVSVRLTPATGSGEPSWLQDNNTAVSRVPLVASRRLWLSPGEVQVDEAAAPSVRMQLVRSGSTAREETFALGPVQDGRLQLPQAVTIGKGQAGAYFLARVVPNNKLDSDDVTSLSIGGNGYDAVVATLEIEDDTNPGLTISPAAQDVAEGGELTLLITAERAPGQDLEVKLACDMASRFVLPSPVVLPAGEHSVEVTVQARQDEKPDVDQVVGFTASAAGYRPAMANVVLVDDDVPTLQLELTPGAVSEDAGALGVSARLRRTDNINKVVRVRFSDNSGGAIYYASPEVVMNAGVEELVVNLGPIDNTTVDGERSYDIQAAVWIASCNCNAAGGTSGGVVTRTLTVYDNDGPTLTMRAPASVLKEGGSMELTVSRNTDTALPLAVTLSANHDEGLEYPSTVTIPAGKTSVTFTVKSSGNTVTGDSFNAVLTAAAQGFARCNAWFTVTDQTMPDARLAAISLSQDEAVVGSTVTATAVVENTGTSALPEMTRVAFFMNGSLVSTAYLQEPLVAGERAQVSREWTLPLTTGAHSIHAVVNDDRKVAELDCGNNTSRVVTATTLPPFTASATTGKKVYKKGEPIPITGKIEGGDVKDKDVEVYVINEGYRHVMNVRTGDDGTFATTYQPYSGQMGRFLVGACYPGEGSNAASAVFSVYGLKRVSNAAVTCDMWVDEPYQGTIAIVNPGQLPLTGVKVSVVSQPEGCNASVKCPETIMGGETAAVSFALTASAVTSGGDWQQVPLRLETSEGVELSMTLYYYCRSHRAQLATATTAINTTMTKGVTRDFPITITNTGKGETGAITLALPGSGWMTTATPMQLPSLAHGEQATIVLQLTPTDGMQLNNPIEGHIGIDCKNGSGLSLPFTVTPVSDAQGTLLVDVCDEWTYNTEEAPHVANAEVVVRSIATGSVVASGRTDAKGLFQATLPEGWYRLAVSANRHNAYSNNILIDPGTETRKTVDLSYQAIDISYNIVETELEDLCLLEHTFTYETNVPKPVVIIEGPTRIDGDNMKAGEQMVLNFTLTNKGLIRTDHVCFFLPEPNKEWTFEALDHTEPFALAPGESVVIPVVLTHFPGEDTPQGRLVRRRISGDVVMAACVEQVTASYRAKCGTELYDNVSAHRMAMKMCASSAILNTMANLAGLTSITGQTFYGGASAVPEPPQPLGDGPGGAGADEHNYPVEVHSDRTVCNPCYATMMEGVLNMVIDHTPVAHVNEGADMAYESVRDDVPPEEIMARRAWEYVQEHQEDLLNALQGGDNEGGCHGGGSEFDEAWDMLINDVERMDELLEGYDECMEERRSQQEGAQQVKARVSGTSWIDAYHAVLKDYRAEIDAWLGIMTELMGDEAWVRGSRSDLMKFWAAVAQKPWTYEDLLPYKPQAVTAQALRTMIDRVKGRQYDSKRLTALADEITELEKKAAEAGFESMEKWLAKAQEDFDSRKDDESRSVCSSISLRFEQQMVMTRQAFRGTLKVYNGNDDTPMKDVRLTLRVENPDGVATTSREMEIALESMTGFTGQDYLGGAWQLGADATGVATVLYIPSRYAAPTQAVDYLFSGTLSYIDPFTGLAVTRELMPVTLTVKPSPSLDLTFFMQRDIMGDDPLTEDVIEPSEEAEFALLINNTGHGDARNVRMVTGQPRIVKNEKELAIDFELVGSQLNGGDKVMALGGSVATDFGTIEAGGSAYAQWWLKSPLLGHFTQYDVKATHVTSYGNPDLTLLNEVTVHELIRSLEVTCGERKLVGFMANDIVDVDDTPDMLYLTDGTVEAVALAAAAVTRVGDNEYVLKVMPDGEGWNYGNVNDPTYGLARLKRVVRESDGVEMSLRNFWTTDRTLRDGKEPLYENRLHFADSFQGAEAVTYRLTFASPAAMCTQELDIAKGWNWISSYLDEPWPLDEKWMQGTQRIMSQCEEVVRDPDYGLVGNLKSIAPRVGYKLMAGENFKATFHGTLCDVLSSPLTVVSGWNWIAWPYNEKCSLAGAVTNAEDGDCLVQQEGFASFADGEWEGSIKVLTPGKGYLYKSVSAKALLLDFTATASKVKDRTQAPSMAALPCMHRYPSTMNITARVYGGDGELAGAGYVIRAFSRGEERGAGAFVGSNYYVTVYGDAPEEIAFVLEDTRSGESCMLEETLVFHDDVVGSRRSPFAFTAGTMTGVGGLAGATRTMTVFSIDGKLLLTGATTQDILRLPPGVYVVDGRKWVVK